MTLHARIVAAAHAALDAQRPDGSFAPGCNGPYADPETALRNTGHWLVCLCAAYRWTGEDRLREAALGAARFVASEKARPAGATFHHRTAPHKDGCNGLIGQAWSIEALAEAAEAFDAPHLSELAENVFLLHPYDEATGLWQRVEVDGRALSCDTTFNHQLWFAAAGALLAPLASAEVTARVTRFLDRLACNVAVSGSGRIRHCIPPGVFWREPRVALRLARTRAREGPAQAHKEAGYHAFNLYALALLRRRAPDHTFWRHRKFQALWRYPRSGEHREAVERNEFAFSYNPTGFEIAFALETIEGPSARLEAEAWVAEQLDRHWDAPARALRRATPDPETLAARLYEAVRLPDFALPAAQDRPATRSRL